MKCKRCKDKIEKESVYAFCPSCRGILMSAYWRGTLDAAIIRDRKLAEGYVLDNHNQWIRSKTA